MSRKEHEDTHRRQETLGQEVGRKLFYLDMFERNVNPPQPENDQVGKGVFSGCFLLIVIPLVIIFIVLLVQLAMLSAH